MLEESHQQLKIENLIQEDTLCELLNCSKNQLARLRNEEGLPFVKVSRYLRIYLEPDFMKWLAGRKTVLNKGESNLKTGLEPSQTASEGVRQA